MIILTGDCHGNLTQRFSYRSNPCLKNLTEKDYVIVLGDFGVPWFNPELEFYDLWTKPDSNKEEHYLLKFLNDKPWTTIVLMGNHDNYDLVEHMPLVEFHGANVRHCVYQNKLYHKIYYVETPQIMTLDGIEFMMIPGADSHDTDYIFDYDDPNVKKYIKHINHENYKHGTDTTYRVNHFSWWEHERVNEELVNDLIKNTTNVDYILSHEPPAAVYAQWKAPGTPGRLVPSKSSEILENVRRSVNYKQWFHGHLHHYIDLPNLPSLGIMSDFIEVSEDSWNFF